MRAARESSGSLGVERWGTTAPCREAYAARVDRRVFRVAMDLVGVCGLLAARHYAGVGEVLVHSYLGNVSASFAVFFVVALPPGMARRPSWAPAALALLIVQGFELTGGFGLMSNTYDPWDLVANLAGVTLAWVTDCHAGRVVPAGRWQPGP